jgi:hypothetical protein
MWIVVALGCLSGVKRNRGGAEEENWWSDTVSHWFGISSPKYTFEYY